MSFSIDSNFYVGMVVGKNGRWYIVYIPNITQKNTNKYKNILFQNDGHVGMANQAKGHKQDGNNSQMQVRETKPN